MVGIRERLMADLRIEVGHEVSGEASYFAAPDQEAADYAEASNLEVEFRSGGEPRDAPPWRSRPPALDVYAARGFRRLAPDVYASRCWMCIWGCRMPVTMIIDHWNPSERDERIETFCYGPLACSLYVAGPPREVPGRKGMLYVEEDWVDDDAVRHREDDE